MYNIKFIIFCTNAMLKRSFIYIGLIEYIIEINFTCFSFIFFKRKLLASLKLHMWFASSFWRTAWVRRPTENTHDVIYTVKGHCPRLLEPSGTWQESPALLPSRRPEGGTVLLRGPPSLPSARSAEHVGRRGLRSWMHADRSVQLPRERCMRQRSSGELRLTM